MGEVAAHAALLVIRVPGGVGRAGVLIAEGDAVVNVVADRLHPRPPGGIARTGSRPGRQLVGLAIAAAEQKDQDVIRQVLEGGLSRVGRRCVARRCRSTTQSAKI